MSECSRAVPVVRWASSRPWSGPSSQPAGARSVGGESVERRSAAAVASHAADPRTPPMPRHAAAARAARSTPIAGRRRTAVRAGALAMSRRSLRLGERRVHARLGSALPCSPGLDARPPEWHRGAMSRAAALATMAFAGMPIACGASTTAVTSSPVASTAAAPCANVAHAELVAVARRIYAQGAHGRNEVSAVRRLARSSSLGRAVAARDPRAVRAALAPLLKHQITRIDVTAGARTLARIGSAPAYAPVSGTIRSGGRVVGRYVLAVSEDPRLRGARAQPHRSDRALRTALPPQARRSRPTLFPSGHATISLALPRLSPSLCGPTAADTRLNAIGYVARNVMRGEARGSAVARTLHHAAIDPAFRSAVAAGDPAAVRAAIVGLFRDNRFHIVRVRAWRGTRLINDVGGPYVLEPRDRHDRWPGGRRGWPLHALRPGRHRLHQARAPIHRCAGRPAHGHRHRARKHAESRPGVRARAQHRELPRPRVPLLRVHRYRVPVREARRLAARAANGIATLSRARSQSPRCELARVSSAAPKEQKDASPDRSRARRRCPRRRRRRAGRRACRRTGRARRPHPAGPDHRAAVLQRGRERRRRRSATRPPRPSAARQHTRSSSSTTAAATPPPRSPPASPPRPPGAPRRPRAATAATASALRSGIARRARCPGCCSPTPTCSSTSASWRTSCRSPRRPTSSSAGGSCARTR